ncbi:tetratricopeptide repeat protein [Candidatus Magnetobacterium casense]|uniref:Tetratricopeptide repeat protein n=1 Tax=Candidatus Magnetobacterium casense TaxID=1455061 RepID=A0ABS6RYT8_9BACT|nr:tetratricopeptide repeat protein [Candidatus Magnetobacterium casensis]MBV6341500.1 tetratricopeptide repeat protein [Candidatus Magnetobacterium casensis]
MNNITITISGKGENDQRAVHIDGAFSHHIAEAEVTALLAETRKNLWRTDTVAGAEIGKRLYAMLNSNVGTLQRIIDAARAVGVREHTHLYLQVPYDLTQLPFELLHNGSFVLLAHNIHVIRLVEDRGKSSQEQPRTEALRMLFMACSPTNLPEGKAINFELEEDRIFNATSDHNIDMQIEDTGSLEGLSLANNNGDGFDIIHILGHAGFDKDKGPVFYMEDDVGKLDAISPDKLWDGIKYRPPKMLFLSGCSTGGTHNEAISESFAYRMAQKGIQWVLGWGLIVSHEGAIQMVTEIYKCLSIGNRLDHAVQIARKSVEDRYHPWPLLRLFGDATPIAPLVEAGLKTRAVHPVKLRHKSLQDSNVRVLEEGFVGRRRNVQQGLSVLRGKVKQFGLLVRGPAGIGKSCLVGKLVERFAYEKDKKELVVFHGVISEANVSLQLKKLLDRMRNRRGIEIMKSDISYEDKIKDLFSSVFKNEISTIIYFDDFEQNLDRCRNEYYVRPETIDIVRPFLEAVEWAEGNSNVVISSRYPFILEHDGEELPATKLYDISLMSFRGADLNKKKRNLEFISKSKQIVSYLEYGNGNPRLLEWLDVIARDEDKYLLWEINDQLKGKTDEFIHKYLADVIAKTEGEDFHKFIQKAAVYRWPVDKTAFDSFGGGKFLDTGVGLTLVEREDLSRGEFVYWVTPVIRESMWLELKTYEEQFAMHEHAYQWYDGWISKADEPNYKHLEEAVSHALAVDNIRGACKHADVLGNYFEQMVLYRQGLAIMEKVAARVSDAVIDEAKEKKDISVDNFFNTYAVLLWNLGDTKQAIMFYEKALAIRLVVYGEKHPNVATSYNNIGTAYRILCNQDQAIVFHEKALTLWLEIYGEKHSDVATSYNNIGVVWHNSDNPKQAIEFYEKALAVCLEIYGERHPNVATSYNNIGLVWYTLGDSKQAITYLEKAIAIGLEVYGEKHPNIAGSYNNIGLTWMALGDSKQAIAYIEKAIAIGLEVYGEKHPNMATSYDNLAKAYSQAGDLQKAAQYTAKAKAAWP